MILFLNIFYIFSIYFGVVSLHINKNTFPSIIFWSYFAWFLLLCCNFKFMYYNMYVHSFSREIITQ
jgi:hypothetical protein